MALYHYLGEDIVEGGTLVLDISWYDDAGASVTPDTATWTLREDKSGQVVNSRKDVEISSLDTTNTLVLTGDDLVRGRLKLYLSATYTSANGSDLPLKSIISFVVQGF